MAIAIAMSSATREQQDEAHHHIDDSLRDQRPRLEHWTSQLEEGLVVMPDERRPQTVNAHRPRREQT